MAKESKDLLEFQTSKLKPTETIIHTTEGYIGEMMGSKDKQQINGVLILTNERIVFFGAKGFLRAEAYQSFQLENVNSTETGQTDIISLFYFVKIFTSAGLVLTFKTQPSKAKEIHDKILDAIATKTKSGNGGGTSIADEIKKLSDLKVAGLLTEEEFTKAKMKLIGG